MSADDRKQAALDAAIAQLLALKIRLSLSADFITWDTRASYVYVRVRSEAELDEWAAALEGTPEHHEFGGKAYRAVEGDGVGLAVRVTGPTHELATAGDEQPPMPSPAVAPNATAGES